MLDVFNNNAFGVIELAEAMNNIPFKPSRLAEMGLFRTRGITTTSAAIEQKDGVLTLIPPTPRGGPGTTIARGRRSMLDVRIPHFEVNDGVMAEEVQGVRAFGTEDALLPYQQLVAERGSEHSQNFDVTEEYNRIGAIKGIITYSDGSTMSLYTTFDVVQESEIDFDLDAGSPAAGALRKKCAAVTRQMGGLLGGLPYTYVHALCGDAFFDDLLAHSEVRDTYKNWSDAQILRDGYVGPNKSSWGMFEFGGIVWENYRGNNGATPYIDTNKCHLFPFGVPNLFRTYFAPADYIETVNTVGKRLYAKMYPMPNGKGTHLDMQMNALSICTRPKVLIQGKRT